VLAFTACIPVRDTWRPALAGALLDDRGAPLTGEAIHACSVSHWQGFTGACTVDDATVTGDGGAFAFDAAKRWGHLDCVLPGEAPLPETLVYACTPSGPAAQLVNGDRVVLRPSRRPDARDDVQTFLAGRCPAPRTASAVTGPGTARGE